MKYILLTQARQAIVDDSDYDWIMQLQYNWCTLFRKDTYYAITNKGIYMHRLILHLTDPKIQTDHINGLGFDNRRENLRIATNSQNHANVGPPRNNISGFKGVTRLQSGKFKAVIGYNGEIFKVGTFLTAEEAAREYDIMAIYFFGEFAKTNFSRSNYKS